MIVAEALTRTRQTDRPAQRPLIRVDAPAFGGVVIFTAACSRSFTPPSMHTARHPKGL